MSAASAKELCVIEVRGFKGSLLLGLFRGVVTDEEVEALSQPSELDRDRVRDLHANRRRPPEPIWKRLIFLRVECQTAWHERRYDAASRLAMRIAKLEQRSRRK